MVDGFVTAFREAPAKLDTLSAIEKRQAELRDLSAGVKETLHGLRSELMRKRILDDGVRIDGRRSDEIRPIACEVRPLPRPHGIALFTRGETQAMVATTLGGQSDEQTIDALTARTSKRFYLHYNFPPFSVGEARMLRGPGRREVGHGILAERALAQVLPDLEGFPYTIRIVSETLESNGSSSMATVCGGTLSLMDAGVPLLAPVAGIAMGLIKEGESRRDPLRHPRRRGPPRRHGLQGRGHARRHHRAADGHQDPQRRLERARARARAGARRPAPHPRPDGSRRPRASWSSFRPRAELSRYAPRVKMITIKPDKIRDIIGPGGKVIRGIQDATGTKIDIEDSGIVTIFSPDTAALELAEGMVNELTQEAELDRIYLGKVKRITDFGAFVEIFPGTDGLIHISHLAEGRVEKVTDVVSEGDEVLAKCIEIDPSGRIRLSRKEALADAAAAAS